MKNLFKGTCLVVALIATFAMVGCGGGGGGGGNNSSAPVTNVSVNIPLPAATATNVKVRAAFKKDTEFKAYYYNDKEMVQPSQYFIDDASATVIFTMVPSKDVVVKSELNKGDGLKPYYQGLISKDKINGSVVKQKLTLETTAMAMLFEEKAKTITTLSVADFEYTLEQEKANGKDVFAILGVTSAVVEKSLTDSTVKNDLAKKVEEAAKKLVITPKPAPQPTPSSYASREALEKASWKAADESVVKRLVTSSASKSAKVLYRYNGEKWETPTEEYLIEDTSIHPDAENLHYYVFGLVNNEYTEMGQAFPSTEGNNTYFSYFINVDKNKNIFGTCSFATAVVDGITYLKATDKEKDTNGYKKVFYMASVTIPEALANTIGQNKNSKLSYVDELNKKLAENTSWKTSSERTIYKHLTTGNVNESIADGGMAAEIIYSTKDGDKWTAPTDKPIIIYDEMGGSHPYCLYKNYQFSGPNQQFHYNDSKNLFRYIQYGDKEVEKPAEEGLEYRELLFSGYYKVEEIKLENVTYYRATNTDKGAKDVYFFKLIKRPEQIK